MSSADYWKKREAENLKNNLKTEAEYTRTINGYYDYMMDQCQKEINGFYQKYATKEGITLAEAKRRVSKLDIEAYGRKAAKYVKEKNFSDQANEEMRLYNATMKINRLEMLKANIGLELVDGFNDLQQFYEEKLTERTLSEFERQAGILGNTIQNNAALAHSIVNASFNNATYSDRIWMYQDMMKAELSKMLQQSLIQGRSSKQMARHLTKLFGVSKTNAERLMVTELRRVQTEAAKQSYIKNGFSEYTFLTANAMGPCEVCKALDGKHFKVEDMLPGENAPPMHPRCHCTTAPYEDDKDYEEWLDYLDKGGTTEEWNQLKSNMTLNDSTDKWAKEVKKELIRDEKSFANRNKEMAVIYDENGNYLFTKRGSEKEVEFTKAEGRRMKNGVVTHNHPSGASFSLSDINMMRMTEMAELRVVTESGVYYMRAPKKWPEKIKKESDLITELKNIRKETRKYYQKLFEDGKINEIERYWLSSDERNRIFAEKYGFEYGKEPF